MYSSISVVVPVYNGENSIGELGNRLIKVLTSITHEYEIIMVDDGSTDNSFSEMSKLHANCKAVNVICLAGNFGQQNAIMCGLRHTTGDFVITIDDDLQHPPEEIPKLLLKLEEGFDVVYGIPAAKNQSIIRNLGTIVTDLFFRLVCLKPKAVKVGSFRGLKRQVVEKISTEKNRSFVYITAITLKHTKNIGNVTVEHANRQYGSSNYNLFKLINLFCKLFINYSGLPFKSRENKLPQYIIKHIEF